MDSSKPTGHDVPLKIRVYSSPTMVSLLSNDCFPRGQISDPAGWLMMSNGQNTNEHCEIQY